MELMKKLIPDASTAQDGAAAETAKPEEADMIPASSAERGMPDAAASTPDPVSVTPAPQAPPAGDAETALEALKRETAALKAALANVENRLSAPPSPPKGGDGGFFSPDEVRKMSRTEVRENMQSIRESMQRWK